MIQEAVKIILPLPPRNLSPNCPVATVGGRMAKAAAAKKYRTLARDAVAEQQISSGPWKMATVRAAFFYATKRRRDQDNAMAMLKPAYDGLVDSGLLIDDDYDHLRRESPTFNIDTDYPRVELTVQRLSAE